jgi:hypothetical protein
LGPCAPTQNGFFGAGVTNAIANHEAIKPTDKTMNTFRESIEKTLGLAPSVNGHETSTTEQGSQQPSHALVHYDRLFDYGYDKSDIHRGNPKALWNLLVQLKRGNPIDPNANEDHWQKQRQEIDEQIVALQKKIEQARADMGHINGTDIPKLEHQIQELDEQILQIQKDQANGLRNPDHLDRFRLQVFWGLFILLTVFVYLFYVSSFYSAFYRDLATEMQAAGQQGVTSVLSAIFSRKAFSTLDFHWVGPFLLFAFGGFLHILSERKGWQGGLMLVSMVLVVLITDMLLAFFIEDKNFSLKVMMGLADNANHQWWTSPVFYLVIAMGFVASLVWSGFLHAIMEEVGKRDVGRLVSLDIQHRKQQQWSCKAQINDLKAKLTALEGQLIQFELDVNSLKDKRGKLVLSEAALEKYVTDLYDGWLSYVNNRLHSDTLRNQCEAVLETYYRQHLPSIPKF